jgi:hypothetical protein
VLEGWHGLAGEQRRAEGFSVEIGGVERVRHPCKSDDSAAVAAPPNTAAMGIEFSGPARPPEHAIALQIGSQTPKRRFKFDPGVQPDSDLTFGGR